MSKVDNAFAVVGIHTGIGKTVVSAVLTHALNAHYWKPIQAGLEERDSDTVKMLIADGEMRVYPEAVALKMPASPHTAAAAEGVVIDYQSFIIPSASRPLIIETAGGVMSPVSDDVTVADMVAWWQLPVVLVASGYLGSISHTLTAIEVLRGRSIHIAGLIFSGEYDSSAASFIDRYTSVPVIGRVPLLMPLNQVSVAAAAADIKSSAWSTLSGILDL